MRIIIVRDGTAIIFSEFGEQPVSFGDAILLGPSGRAQTSGTITSPAGLGSRP
ncbi:hypothetical protein ACGFIR_14640 [Micromonospora sp. NPDC049051]|uniref:hypothetical protein n=1 Tax=Micromonospora sp. NPDC049051 TaxID=3364264 RepID=UPI0037137FBF